MRGGIKDSGWKGPIAAMIREIGHTVTVGVHEDDTERDGINTNASILEIHEYGLGNVPERSSLRSTFDENINYFHGQYRKMYRAAALGFIYVGTIPELMGQRARSLVMQKIRSNIPPPLADATVKAKGSSTALIDEGLIINAIDYQVN